MIWPNRRIAGAALPRFDQVEVGLLIGAAVFGVLALRRAPRATVAALFMLAVLVRFGAVEGDRLPGAGAVVAAGAAVKNWQAERIHAGACYYRGVIALNDGDLERLDAVSSECGPRSGGPSS